MFEDFGINLSDKTPYLKLGKECVQGFMDGIKTVENATATIKRVIFHEPATIVYWNDGTKTVVKAVNEPFDREKGLAMAILKKRYGNTGRYYNELKKWL